jgi:serine/threonine-protein phosphatase Stp1
VPGEFKLKSDDELTGPIGSTVVTLMAHQGHYACIWAGDSRAYVLRGGRVQQITRDHSLVQELIDAGSLDPLRSLNHRSKHVVTRAVGAQSLLDLDGVYGHIELGDRFLLCSDGVIAVLDDAELGELMGKTPLDVAVSQMMRACLERGAPDNVTFVLIEAIAA